MVVRPMEMSEGNTKNFLVAGNFYGRCRVHRFIAMIGQNLGQIGVCEIGWSRYRNRKENSAVIAHRGRAA
jgi:hypothetical protein